MRLYGDIHVAMHGELDVLREVLKLVLQWVDEYPHFDEVEEMAEAITEELQQYESDAEDTVATLTWKISTESSGPVLVFLNDMVEAYPQMELAVAAKLIYPNSHATEYFAYYSPEGETTIFAAAEDPFSDQNRVISREKDWYEDDWPEDGYEENTSGRDAFYDVEWDFPEEAEWIPFGR